MKQLLIGALALCVLSMPDVHAFPVGETCEEQPFQPETGCPAPFDEEQDPALPPPLPQPGGTPTSPPATTPPAQITTSAQAVAQLHLLADYYVTIVIAEASGRTLSRSEIDAALMPLATGESLPPNLAALPNDRKLLRFKVRLLKANHADFQGDTMPAQFLGLLERLGELDLEARGLEAES